MISASNPLQIVPVDSLVAFAPGRLTTLIEFDGPDPFGVLRAVSSRVRSEIAVFAMLDPDGSWREA